MKKRKSALVLLLCVMFLFGFSQFTAAGGEPAETEDAISMPVAGDEAVTYEELITMLEPLGLDEVNAAIAQARTIQEIGELYLAWVISLEGRLPVTVYRYMLESTLASIHEASQKENYTDVLYEEPEYAEEHSHDPNEIHSFTFWYSKEDGIYRKLATTYGGESYFEPGEYTREDVDSFYSVNHTCSYPAAWNNTYPGYHYKNCTICGNLNSASHTPAFRNNGNGHVKYCTICDYSYGVYSHACPGAVLFTAATNHYKLCTDCKKIIALAEDVITAPVLNDEDVTYEELIAMLEPLGLDEVNAAITQARTIQEIGELYLAWVSSLEGRLPEPVYRHMLESTLASIDEASQKENYTDVLYEEPEYAEEPSRSPGEIHSFTFVYGKDRVYRKLVTTYGGETYFEPGEYDLNASIQAAWDCSVNGHSLSPWRNTNSVYHFKNCTYCAYSPSENHKIAYTLSGTKHEKYCYVCTYSYGMYSHACPGAVLFTTATNHYKLCTDCKGSIAFPHNIHGELDIS